jgi:hypothetical protein
VLGPWGTNIGVLLCAGQEGETNLACSISASLSMLPNALYMLASVIGLCWLLPLVVAEYQLPKPAVCESAGEVDSWLMLR